MRPLAPLLCLLLVAGASYAQSQLPACQGGYPSRWSNCTGRWLNINGDKYEGEWRDGKPSGFGVQTFASGEKYTGTWKDGKYEGQGTIAAANGTVISQGIWSANQLVRPTNPAVAQVSEAQRLENERKAAQLEQECVRLAQERERLDADKFQREKAKQTASIRHTYTTLELLRNSTDIHTLSRQMGNSALMIERYYSKLTATMTAERLA